MAYNEKENVSNAIDLNHTIYLIREYDFEKRYKNLLIQIQDVLEAFGVLDKVQINTDLLGQAVLHYFEDKDRLRKFHGIKLPNEEKIYGYGTFWLLRDKPIQIISPSMPREYLYINEKVFAWMLISKMLKEVGVTPDKKNPKTLAFLNLLYYNFRFRDFTQRSLEMMVAGFFWGYKFGSPD